MESEPNGREALKPTLTPNETNQVMMAVCALKGLPAQEKEQPEV